jgi:hypothetical protein
MLRRILVRDEKIILSNEKGAIDYLRADGKRIQGFGRRYGIPSEKDIAPGKKKIY